MLDSCHAASSLQAALYPQAGSNDATRDEAIPAENTRASKYLHNMKHTLQQAFGRSAESSPEEQNITALVARLEEIFSDVGLYRKLLACSGSHAQKLLDVFQWLLDMPDIEPPFRRGLIVAMQRLSNKSGRYPACYELEGVVQEGQHPVAAGGFADIYKGNFRGQMVCMKAIRIYQTTAVEEFVKQFSREAILWGQLSHPNVVPIYGLYRVLGRICLVSPWMGFGDITKYLKRSPEAPRLRLALDVAEGLSYLHENGIVHGDLKGPNILVNDVGMACIADFGISSVSDSVIPAWTSHSSMASRGGSVRWQAPELFDTEKDEMVKNNVQSDIYALSCVFYEIFTGSVPFEHIQLETAVALKIMSGARPARPPNSSRCWQDWGFTETIWSLMEDCWSQAPLERPGIEEIIGQLDPELIGKRRPNTIGSIVPPSCFRQRVTQPQVTMTVHALDRLLDSDVETEVTKQEGVVTRLKQYRTQSLNIPSSTPLSHPSTDILKGNVKANPDALVMPVAIPNDNPKATKKEAQRARKEVEKRKRVIAEIHQRERARAVMQKRREMMKETKDTDPKWRGLAGAQLAGW